MDDEERFISFIHNYCDRWCERCDLSDRCRVFAMEAEMSDEEKDIESPAFVQSLTNILEDAQKMLLEKAEEFGIDLSAADDPQIAASRKLKRQMVKADQIAELAEKYASDARPVLEARESWLTDSVDDDPTVADMIAILYWYQFFIGAKTQRGLSGIVDLDGGEDAQALDDPQSDANGSIKIALIAMERSILAWTYLMSPANAAVIRPMIDLLEEMRSLTDEKFPIARDFVRPGFDELETVM